MCDVHIDSCVCVFVCMCVCGEVEGDVVWCCVQVDVPVFESGDVVRMISDMAEVYRLQQGHGEWNGDMALVSGTLLVSV